MKDKTSVNRSTLEKEFDAIEKESPVLKDIIEAFRSVFISRNKFKARLSHKIDVPVPEPDIKQLAQGNVWLAPDIIISMVDPWGDSIKEASEPLSTAFPALNLALQRLTKACDAGEMDFSSNMKALVDSNDRELNDTALSIEIEPAVLKFILNQILKPFVEKGTSSMHALIQDKPWHKGYCPVCGFAPELSFIKGDKAQRWLRCSLCGHEWKFDRMACPNCEVKHEHKELLQIEGFEHRWIEPCPKCNKYIVGLDLRRKNNISTELAALSMVHLDAIAQQKGYLPIAECAWNIIVPNIQTTSNQ
jgi:FdhE protein